MTRRTFAAIVTAGVTAPSIPVEPEVLIRKIPVRAAIRDGDIIMLMSNGYWEPMFDLNEPANREIFKAFLFGQQDQAKGWA